ncbi:MAG: HNH endonuclease [Byssovorax sp.]
MTDAEFAAALRQALGENFEGSILRSNGSIVASSPAGWTWHHVPNQPGVLQLVPRIQHATGSAFQPLLHPNGVGGMYIWGSQY